VPLDEDKVALLGELGRALHQATLPADAVEERLAAVARRLGIEGEFFTLQSFLAMELRADGVTRAVVGRMSFDTHWNLTRMTALIALSDRLVAGTIGVEEARREIAAIPHRRNPYPNLLVVLAYGVYGAAVAARIGGSALEMLVAGVVGFLAGAIHYGTLQSNTVDLQKSFLAALVSALGAFLFGHLFSFDQPRALFAGITLLVPAMVVTVGIHELASEALESGVARLAYGLLRFAMMSVGIAAAINLTHAATWPASVAATPLPPLIKLVAVAVGGVALVFCLQAPPRDAGSVVVGALVAYGAQELTKWVLGDEHGAPVASAFVLGAVSYLHARATGRAAPLMLVPGLLQLAPGFMGTKAILHLLQPNASIVRDVDGFAQVVFVAVQLGLGVLIADLLLRPRRRLSAVT
jgi:uncharacterized membrane protein YjjP (DUF1212 family)